MAEKPEAQPNVIATPRGQATLGIRAGDTHPSLVPRDGRVGLRRATIYKLQAEGRFPRRVKITGGRAGADDAANAKANHAMLLVTAGFEARIGGPDVLERGRAGMKFLVVNSSLFAVRR